MNIGQIRKKCLQKINEYSNNGSIISEAQNKDYTLRINGYINDAQLAIARVRKIYTSLALVTPDEVTDLYNKYNMPTNFMELKQVTLNELPFFGQWQNKTLMISKAIEGDLVVNYYRYPAEIKDDTTDDTELEIDIDAQTIIPYYAGGYVLFDERADVGTQLINQYEVLLSRLGSTPEYGIRQISSIYGM
jgi:hypothetical protein